MNIAVVGGGRRCKDFMDVIQRHAFIEVNPKIVAVADIRNRSSRTGNHRLTTITRAQNKGTRKSAWWAQQNTTTTTTTTTEEWNDDTRKSA